MLGSTGVERLLQNMHDEINRNMVLMGCKNISELNRTKLFTENKMKLAKSLERLGTESAFSVLAEAKKLEAQGKPMIHLGLGQP